MEQEKTKEIAELKAQIADKDEELEKYRMFIDICNGRVMLHRERLAGNDNTGGNTT